MPGINLSGRLGGEVDRAAIDIDSWLIIERLSDGTEHYTTEHYRLFPR
jgi:hypothetical protein